MKANCLTNPTYSPHKTVRRNFGMQNNALRQRSSYGKRREKFTVKELDAETGLYYYGARYLDPKTSRWLSGDPAMGEYLPVAPINDDAKKHNGNLPGQGGVFNYVNLHAYHYAGNNPVKYTDPDGRFIIITQLTNSSRNQHDYIRRYPSTVYYSEKVPMAFVPSNNNSLAVLYAPVAKTLSGNTLRLENRIDSALRNIEQDTNIKKTIVTASSEYIGDGIYKIDVQVNYIITDPFTGKTETRKGAEGTIAYATRNEVGASADGSKANQTRVNAIANSVFKETDINERINN